MSNHHNDSNLGEQFTKAVTEGLSTGDFQKLNFLVNDTVSDAISQAGNHIKNASDSISSHSSKIYQTSQEYIEKQRERNERLNKSSYQTISRTSKLSNKTTKKQLPAVKNVGQVSSILYILGGGIGTVATGGILLSALFFYSFGITWPIWSFIIIGLLFLGSIFTIRKGLSERKRLKRMKRYLSLCAGKMYVNISDLAGNIGKSTKFVLKDVKKMLELGFFPEGHLDEKETCLMLDDSTYQEYLKLEKERKIYELEAAQKKQSLASNPQLEAMLSEGNEYIRKLHELNDIIPGEVISQKMYRTEHLLKEIFKRLEEDPTQLSQMQKLMNYYLPTTIKLLQSYADFDNISSPGVEVIKAKTEIEKTVDTINEAFTELLNKLFQSAVFDAATDAQVLQTMLAKEGLTKSNF